MKRLIADIMLGLKEPGAVKELKRAVMQKKKLLLLPHV